MPKDFSPTLLGITPQGWMRKWDAEGRVSPSAWTDAESALAQADAVVISREDVGSDDEVIEHMAHQTRVLAVTEGAAGAVLYWNGDRRRFRAPQSAGSGRDRCRGYFCSSIFCPLIHDTRSVGGNTFCHIDCLPFGDACWFGRDTQQQQRLKSA